MLGFKSPQCLLLPLHRENYLVVQSAFYSPLTLQLAGDAPHEPTYFHGPVFSFLVAVPLHLILGTCLEKNSRVSDVGEVESSSPRASLLLNEQSKADLDVLLLVIRVTLHVSLPGLPSLGRTRRMGRKAGVTAAAVSLRHNRVIFHEPFHNSRRLEYSTLHPIYQATGVDGEYSPRSSLADAATFGIQDAAIESVSLPGAVLALSTLRMWRTADAHAVVTASPRQAKGLEES
ncbi:hypothetical protein VTK73DRAFT_684 [Phialemonium thermophilum]|uniref:Uncharacterized protein n=1 Tax=Phialemonium thermophilum TaxID=223376 RepID=A0ABR3XDF4_9PEZI